MLRNIKDLRGYAIRATDGVIGSVDDVYFDDDDWAIRYFVVDTGNWLAGRKVLISPLAIGEPDWLGHRLPVALTMSQVEQSPDIDTRKPVSRQHEASYSDYYDYPYYWGGAGLWGLGAYPGSLTAENRFEAQLKAQANRPVRTSDDSHLRSSVDLVGHHIQAIDGSIGHVHDLVVDDHTWAIRYMVVDTSNWWGGHKVLVSPQWIDEVSWPEATVTVGLTRQAIKDAPAYDAAAQIDRQMEQAIYEHYGRPVYWSDQAIRELEARVGR